MAAAEVSSSCGYVFLCFTKEYLVCGSFISFPWLAGCKESLKMVQEKDNTGKLRLCVDLMVS